VLIAFLLANLAHRRSCIRRLSQQAPGRTATPIHVPTTLQTMFANISLHFTTSFNHPILCLLYNTALLIAFTLLPQAGQDRNMALTQLPRCAQLLTSSSGTYSCAFRTNTIIGVQTISALSSDHSPSVPSVLLYPIHRDD
jgi:hypothetical protein